DPHDRLHLGGVGRRDGGGRDAVLGLAPERRIGISIEIHVLIGGEDPLAADRGRKLHERAREVALGYAGRCRHVVSPKSLRCLLCQSLTGAGSSSTRTRAYTSRPVARCAFTPVRMYRISVVSSCSDDSERGALR